MKIIEACDSHAFMSSRWEKCGHAKETVRLAPQPLSRAANLTSIRPNRACALQEGCKSANVHAG